ncbi:Uncharacterised protein [Candidatus Anstonella stagnisolia]|nr:Uncharacterised protein [Candidatus Anstonella stagnisolia]
MIGVENQIRTAGEAVESAAKSAGGRVVFSRTDVAKLVDRIKQVKSGINALEKQGKIGKKDAAQLRAYAVGVEVEATKKKPRYSLQELEGHIDGIERGLEQGGASGSGRVLGASISLAHLQISNPFAFQALGPGWAPNLQLSAGYGFGAAEQGVKAGVGVSFEHDNEGYSAGVSTARVEKFRWDRIANSADLGLWGGSTRLSHILEKGSRPFSAIQETHTGLGYAGNLRGGRFGIMQPSSTPAVVSEVLGQTGVIGEDTVFSPSSGWGVLPLVSSAASILYSGFKRLHEATGLFSFMFKRKALKSIGENERGRKLAAAEVREVEAALNAIKPDGAGMPSLEKLGKWAQYKNLPEETKKNVHALFYENFIAQASNGTLRLDEVEACSKLALAIKFSALEQANVNIALDWNRWRNASGVADVAPGQWRRGTLAGTLEGLGVFTKEYSVGAPIGMRKHGANFFTAIREDIGWDPRTWLKAIGNAWDYFSPVYDRSDARKMEIQKRVGKAVAENEAELKKSEGARNHEKIFANLVYLRGYFGSKQACDEVLGRDLSATLKSHFEKYGREYALSACTAVSAEYAANGGAGMQLYATMAVESAIFLEQFRSLGSAEMEAVEGVNKLLGQNKKEYEQTLVLLSPASKVGAHSFERQAQLFLDGKLKEEEKVEFLNKINVAKAVAAGSGLIWNAYTRVMAPFEKKFDDSVKKDAKWLAKELKKDFDKIEWSEVAKAHLDIEIAETAHNESAKIADGACFKAVKKKLENLAEKVGKGEVPSDSEVIFVRFVRYELSGASLGLLGTSATKRDEIYAEYKKIDERMNEKKIVGK